MILGVTVKKDETSKVVTFEGMLLAQTEEDQLNIGYHSESSTGKTWIALQIVWFFPESEHRIYAGASPTAFFHEVGVWDKERKVILVDLENKILIFLDQPHWQLMEKLRPLLSHDQKKLIYKITDKTGKGGLRTKTVEITGFSSVIFCTTKPVLDDQDRTRLWLLSPESTQEKLDEALRLTALKESDRRAFAEWVNGDPKRRWLKERVRLIRESKVKEVIIRDIETVLERYLKDRPYLKPRDLRDLPRLSRLIKGFALLNCMHREHKCEDTIVASEEDIEDGFTLYRGGAESNELGLSPETYDVFKHVIEPFASNGMSKMDIAKKYWEIYHRFLSEKRLKEVIISSLESVGLIREEANPADKREKLWYCTIARYISPAAPKTPEKTPEKTTSDESTRYIPDNSAVIPPQSVQSPDLVEHGDRQLAGPCELCGKNSAAVWLEGVVEGRKLAACRSCVEEMKAGKKDLS